MEKEYYIQTNIKLVFNLNIHLVFVTKYRRKVFTAVILDDLMDTFSKVFEAFLIICNGKGNYIHLLITYPPKVSVSKLVNSLRGVSSRLIRNRGHLTVQRALWIGSLWSSGYFAASCGGAPLSSVRQHIEAQKTPN